MSRLHNVDWCDDSLAWTLMLTQCTVLQLSVDCRPSKHQIKWSAGLSLSVFTLQSRTTAPSHSSNHWPLIEKQPLFIKYPFKHYVQWYLMYAPLCVCVSECTCRGRSHKHVKNVNDQLPGKRGKLSVSFHCPAHLCKCRVQWKLNNYPFCLSERHTNLTEPFHFHSCMFELGRLSHGSHVRTHAQHR